METKMKSPTFEEKSHYRKILKMYGVTPQGVGWKNEVAQKNRFEQLTKIIKEKEALSINDMG